MKSRDAAPTPNEIVSRIVAKRLVELCEGNGSRPGARFGANR